jgi:diguanylate cyclase (GGDEF)-like protein
VVLFVTAGLLFGWLRLKKEISLRKLAEAEVRHLAYNDPLTGIANLNTFLPYASKQLFAANRNKQKIAFCFIDLNKFKDINDNYGHKCGDGALIHVARAITSVIRESDLAARIGGDEFVVLLTGIHNLEDTQRTIGQIQQAVAQPFVFAGNQLNISASIGVAIYPDDGAHVDELMTKADTAMYKNKTAMKAEINIGQISNPSLR